MQEVLTEISQLIATFDEISQIVPDKSDTLLFIQTMKEPETRLNYIVYGFIRSRLVPNGYQNQMIKKIEIPPKLVGNLCISYYNLREYFSATDHGKYFQINECQNTATIDARTVKSGTAYGVLDITKDLPFIYIWYVKVIVSQGVRQDYNGNNISIGIDSSDKECKEAQFWMHFENAHHHYALNSIGYIHCLDDKYMDRDDFPPSNSKHKIGLDKMVKIELNIPKRTMKFYIDSIDLGIGFNDIYFDEDTRYNFAVWASAHRIKIKICHFEEIFVG